jgi:hypothetical protein
MLFRAFPAIAINKQLALTATLLVSSTLPHSEVRGAASAY